MALAGFIWECAWVMLLIAAFLGACGLALKAFHFVTQQASWMF